MKFFINNPKDILQEALQVSLLHQPLKRIKSDEVNVVIRSDWDKKKVSLISGGGSGHEPAHVGFVGKGLLTAAVCGEIFASPSVDAVLTAIISTTGESGCLLIIKNYTGDRLNFGLAAEQAKALGYQVEMVIVGDDIALGTSGKRRGLAGTILAHKIAGYYAEKGKSLIEIKQIVEEALNDTFTIGLSLTSCQKFDQQAPERLHEDQAELGLGIHGEPGIKTIPYSTADNLLKEAVDLLIPYLTTDSKYTLLLNNLGTVTSLELSVILNSLLHQKDLQPVVNHILGPHTFMTALNMKGISITLIKETPAVLEALAADSNSNWFQLQQIRKPDYMEVPDLPKIIQSKASSNAKNEIIIKEITALLIKSETELNAIDQLVGDGDAGSTFAIIGNQITRYAQQLPYDDIQALLATIGRLTARDAGGSSGVLLSIMFTKAAEAYSVNQNLGTALSAGLDQMMAYGGAKEGARTMIDALSPAFKAISDKKDLTQIADAARQGAESTKKITKTNFGRSSYLNEETLKNIVDPGAEIVARIFEQLALKTAK
ncbi:dihydroxyacetone kinase [Sphingobacterium sp. ML3W]|uniref:dihydroxyacetone kinase subunit DhaK n=1 Tax=Sphingobacterium sp. ML3W TaxID=1538644 RepID=UPI0004F799C0|nr:dihydroxyacetone kinase subunit DhaK [Sphingobacterium sp. ML3W]AIM35819.1 dihydroxyacetone kinase [Sphingobacterium sp. ML3W]